MGSNALPLPGPLRQPPCSLEALSLSLSLSLPSCLLAALSFCSLAAPCLAQTTYYVSHSTGNDTFTGGLTDPFKTIGAALNVVQIGDTVQVAGGASNIYADEDFPLVVDVPDVRIQGSRVPKPTIRLQFAQFDVMDPTKAAILVDGVSGCVIDNLLITGAGFDKTTDAEKPEEGLHGIHVQNLPPGGEMAIRNCTIEETFNGIFFSDGSLPPPPQKRTVEITDTEVSGCGPVKLDITSFDQGHAAIRLLEAQTPWIDLVISDCILEDNHDALEPGESTLYLRDSMFVDNENGLEYANTPGGEAYVDGCLFQENARFALPEADNEGNPIEPFVPTGGIVARYNAGFDLTVRGTHFDRNQIGVGLRGEADSVGVADFGSSFDPIVDVITAVDPPLLIPRVGGNTFTTDTTAPWYQGLEHTVSYCGLHTTLNTEVLAVGNTWHYEALQPGDPDFNQGADSAGQFPATMAFMEVPPDTNFEDNPPQLPYAELVNPPHRGFFGCAPPETCQVPWNYSTGLEHAGSGHPSILLVP